MDITNDYDSFNKCSDNENGDINLLKYLLLSIPSGILLRSLIGSLVSQLIWQKLNIPSDID